MISRIVSLPTVQCAHVCVFVCERQRDRGRMYLLSEQWAFHFVINIERVFIFVHSII